MRRTARLSFAALATCLLLLVGSNHVAPAANAPRRPASSGRSLNRVLPEMKFDGIAFGEAIEFLRDVTGANLHVNWKAVESAGVTKDTPINVRLRQVTLKKVLSLMLSEAAPGGELTYQVDGGVIEITTRELADRNVYTVVYPIEDLIMEIPDFTDAPTFNLDQQQNGSGGGGGGGGGRGGGGGGGGGQGLFGGQGQSMNREDPGKTKDERANELMDLIRELIYPNVWRENGGPASIRYFNGHLIVTAPRSVHEAIGGVRD
jgi:uncharacterized membrane protein YgcG